jgi:hypothetical protein
MRWGLVVQQPYAQFIAEGWKWTETRAFVPRTTLQPGDDLVIIAGQTNTCGRPRAGEHWSDPIAGWRMRRTVTGQFARRRDSTELVRLPELERIRLSFGSAICVVRYDGAHTISWEGSFGRRSTFPMLDGHKLCAHQGDPCDQDELGDFTEGRKAWLLSNPRKLAHQLPMTREASTSRHMQGVFELTPAAQQWVADELEAA